METLANLPLLRCDTPRLWEDWLVAPDKHPQAKEFFDTLNKLNRYAICHRIETARRPETRQARIEKFTAMLTAHEKLYP